MKTLLHVLTY